MSTGFASSLNSRRTRAQDASRQLRVVYVAGSGHTGSTLLAMLLDSHPRIVSVGEVAVKRKIRRRGDSTQQQCSCGATIGECPFWLKIFQNVNDEGFEFGPHHWSNDYRIDQPVVHALLTRDSPHKKVRAFQHWAARRLPVHAWRMRRTDRVNVAFIRAALSVANADVFCDATKRTMRLTRLLAIPELDVKVIRLVRDVRGYAASAKRRGHSVLDAARTWTKDQQVIAEITSGLPTNRQFLVRYEDLCTDPEGTLRRLHAFCEVEPLDTVSSVVFSGEHHVLGNSMRLNGSIHVRLDESWRSKLSREEHEHTMAIAGLTNRGFGYL